jgi:diguanylate cyclase (GGDEF)-like protein
MELTPPTPLTPLAPPAPRLFFLDDDKSFLEALRRVLHPMRSEWDMTFLGDPKEAVEAIAGERAALLVSDWMMQGPDGLSVCRDLRRQEAANPDLARYVILLTGRQSSDDQVVALDGGADDFIVKPFDHEILLARIRVGLRLLALQVKLQDANQRLLEMATRDALTGAFNRRQGIEIVLNEMSRVLRGQQCMTVILMDLDKFKKINDVHGHGAGDEILKTAVTALKGSCRRYDVVIRWGGDELLVVCPNATEEQSLQVAERFRQAVEAIDVELETGIHVKPTASLGVVTLPECAQGDVERMIALCDRSLDAVKKRGGNGMARSPWIPFDAAVGKPQASGSIHA